MRFFHNHKEYPFKLIIFKYLLDVYLRGQKKTVLKMIVEDGFFICQRRDLFQALNVTKHLKLLALSFILVFFLFTIRSPGMKMICCTKWKPVSRRWVPTGAHRRTGSHSGCRVWSPRPAFIPTITCYLPIMPALGGGRELKYGLGLGLDVCCIFIVRDLAPWSKLLN